MNAYKIVIKPIITEKITRLNSENHYAFEVAKDANKIQVGKAIQELYPDVKIKEVRTMVVRGKRRRQFTKKGAVEGRRRSYKKAIVTLKEGKIDFYENI
jgi:large subunit ribosomal protein L23